MSAHHSATSEVRVSAAYIQMAETKERAARRVETSIYLGPVWECNQRVGPALHTQ